MKALRYLLLPITPIYYVVTWVRNLLYDKGLKSSKSYDFPVICVGNLSAGGTGKTPMVEYLIRLLKGDVKLATLSRGYGRQSEGFQLGNEQSNASILGDEPFQFYNKFSKDIQVAVDGNRQNGIAQLLELHPETEVVLLDDAFQHRKVKAGFNILLTTYSNLYTNDIVLPTGNLREPKKGAKRANIIVVTKCPNRITEAEKNTIIKKLNPLKTQHVFFSHIKYSDSVLNETEDLQLTSLPNFKLVTGIANPNTLIDFLKESQLDFQHLNFKDHHVFSDAEIANLSKFECIVTTEKDYMRIKNEPSLNGKLYYLPIEIEMDKPKVFDTLIKDFAIK